MKLYYTIKDSNLNLCNKFRNTEKSIKIMFYDMFIQCITLFHFFRMQLKLSMYFKNFFAGRLRWCQHKKSRENSEELSCIEFFFKNFINARIDLRTTLPSVEV